MCKCSNVQRDNFPQAGARVHYYIRDNTLNGATIIGNTNIDYYDEAFENMPDDGEQPVSNKSELNKPLPLLFDYYQWTKSLD